MGQDGEAVELPSEMDIPDGLEGEDEISDHLLDMTGLCHFGFALEGHSEMKEVISKIEHELEFQRKQAKEYEKGIFKNEITFARYDQAAKMLEWVLTLLKENKS